MSSTEWFTSEQDNGVHVLPEEDQIVHDKEDCICGPRIELVKRDDGSDNWLYVHMSLDGREVKPTS